MHKLNHNISRVIISLFFLLCALSPFSITVFQGKDGFNGLFRYDAKQFRMGFVWAKVVLNALDRDLDDVNNDGTPDGDMILVEKHHAVIRGKLDIRPILAIFFSPYANPHSGEPLLSPFRERSVPKDVHHQERDGYLSLCTGHSPPFLFA